MFQFKAISPLASTQTSEACYTRLGSREKTLIDKVIDLELLTVSPNV
jgi:hypothetical protein